MTQNRKSRTLGASITAAVLLVPALSSCSTKILDSLNSTTTSSVVTTTTIPTGDVVTLLQQLSTAVTGLGDAVVAKDNAHTSQALATVDATWIALQPQLAELDKQHGIKPIDTGLVDDVERIVNLVRSAVKKKRPADADKAARFIPLVLDATK